MRLKRVGVFSWGLVSCIWYVGLGLIIGGVITLMTLLGLSFNTGNDRALLNMLFGVTAVIFIPLFLSFFGFIGGIITAFIYNLYAGWTGGIEMEFDIESDQNHSS